MATAGIVNGHNMRFKKGGTAIARATNCKMSIKNKVRQTSHKDQTGGWETNDYGEFSGTWSTDMLVEETANNASTIAADMIAKTKLVLVFGTGVTGDTKYEATGIITDLEIDAANNENVTASASGVFDGAVAVGTF